MTLKTSQVPKEILENLKAYKKHRPKLCLECGYQGLMGIHSCKKPILRPFIVGLITIAASLVIFGFSMGFLGLAISGALGGLVGGITQDLLAKTFLLCPSCQKLLIC